MPIPPKSSVQKPTPIRSSLKSTPVPLLHFAFPTLGESTTVASTEASTDGITASFLASYRLPPVLGFLPACPKMSLRVSSTRGTAELNNFPTPWIRHTLTVVIKRGWLSPKRTEKHHRKVRCTTWVASHCVHLSILTRCVVQIPLSA